MWRLRQGALTTSESAKKHDLLALFYEVHHVFDVLVLFSEKRKIIPKLNIQKNSVDFFVYFVEQIQ